MSAFVCIPENIVASLKERLSKGEITPEDVTEMLPEEQAALKSILEEFVADKLGIKVSDKEVEAIRSRAEKIEKAQEKLGDNIGNPDNLQENIDFFKAKKEMEDYLLSHSPANKLKVLTGTIGRGMMLASVKSPVLNIGSNIEVGFTESLSRRLSGGGVKGADNKLALDYVKLANKVYQETGYDISRMTDLKDTGTMGERVLGKTVHSQGPGIIRKAGRVVEDIVFKQLMGAPDVAFSSAHFADSVNTNSLKMSKGDKGKATEIMTDSMRLVPRTPEGEILRAQGVLDAQVATWTNESWASKFSEGVRKILNDLSGDARIGDYVFPFVKTPSNVIATGLDYAGLGALKAVGKTYKAFKTGDLKSPEYIKSISRDLVRSGLGIAGALVISSQLNDDDFVGAYDPQRAQIEALRNSNTNSIRVGKKWISTDWLGPLAVPVTAIMYARKYGKDTKDKPLQYLYGMGNAVAKLPVVDEIVNGVRQYQYNKVQSADELGSSAADYVVQEAKSRLVPSIFSDVAKAVDPQVRDTSGGPFGINKVIGGTPFLSKTLPAKIDTFGEPIRGEGPITDILFGSRVKTDKETPIVKEISRVSDSLDKGVTFTDFNKSTSKTLAQFKEKVGQDKYKEAAAKYGQELKTALEKTLNDPRYKKLSDEDKLKVINGKDQDAMDKVFRQYGFKYRSTPTAKLPQNL